jgi:hypothetical protein
MIQNILTDTAQFTLTKDIYHAPLPVNLQELHHNNIEDKYTATKRMREKLL